VEVRSSHSFHAIDFCAFSNNHWKCSVCGLPAEYCEFGPNFDKCKPWLLEHAPDLYPQLKEGIRPILPS
jgi:hypothetical protein